MPDAVLGRRALERLDLLLLTVESLDMNGGEAMLWATRQLGFESIFPTASSLETSLPQPTAAVDPSRSDQRSGTQR